MRKLLFASLAVLALSACSASAQMWNTPGVYFNSYSVNPYWSAPMVYPGYVAPVFPGYSVQRYSSFNSPYGYLAYSSYGYASSPLGGTYYSNSGFSARPYSSGPFHSVYFDPFANTYRYTPGPTSGNQSFFFRYGYGY